jgi:ferredoxin
MSVKKTGEIGLKAWVDSLIDTQEVIGVKAKGERFAFGPLEAADDLRLDYDVTILPPKKYLLPQAETVLKFGEDGDYSSVLDEQPRILFGVHPYDVVAIAQMDAVFEKDNADIHYLTRRRNTAIVANDIQTPSPNVFAGCMNTAVVQDGFDVLISKIGDDYLVDARTDTGEALIQGLDGDRADELSLARREQLWDDNRRLLRNHQLKVKPEELPDLLEEGFNSGIWDKRAEKCYSCGSCNLVCPTCYCFDMRDDVNWNLKSGERKRSWDGCLLSNFALVAGGHNFRSNRTARYRHRFYRKGKYLWDRMGQIACVGCGRCITACTTHIANPVEVYNALLEER